MSATDVTEPVSVDPGFEPRIGRSVSLDHAAQMLGVSRRTIWLLAKQGELRPVHIRSCARWRRADVLRYIDRLDAWLTAEGAGRE